MGSFYFFILFVCVLMFSHNYSSFATLGMSFRDVFGGYSGKASGMFFGGFGGDFPDVFDQFSDRNFKEKSP